MKLQAENALLVGKYPRSCSEVDGGDGAKKGNEVSKK